MKLIIKKWLPQLMVSLEAREYLENFLVSAVFSIFAIRVFLSQTGYPQIGGGGLHIAHMLWGGLLMLIALVILLAFLGWQTRHIASIIGGVGFGVFIDELGKFITSDNNYFFQPTIALLYVAFILLLFVFRSLEKHPAKSERDYLINALEFFKGGLHHGLDKDEKVRVSYYLNQCDPNNPTVKHLKATLKSISVKPTSKKYPIRRFKKSLSKAYLKLVSNKYLAKSLMVLFILVSLLNVFFTLDDLVVMVNKLSFWDWGQLAVALSVALTVTIGVNYLRKHNRLAAYRLFRYAIMIDIFLGQFFLFYREGLSSYLRLLISISIYFSLQYLISQEKAMEKR
ncbi:hypothetical protein ACFL0Y_02065 [Patescibacteria group bacterium]